MVDKHVGTEFLGASQVNVTFSPSVIIAIYECVANSGVTVIRKLTI